MGKSVKAIGQKKWETLTPVQQHAAIARYALECLDRKTGLGSFLEFYRRLMSGAGIDRYSPPGWLNERERLQSYFAFHQKLSKKPLHYFKTRMKGQRIPWNPCLPVSVILDQVITPFNVGSVLRLVDNFGFAELIYHNPHLDLGHANLRRSARGCENWIPIRHVDDLPAFLRELDMPLVALEKTRDARPVEEWEVPRLPFGLVVGNEVYGVSRAILKICSQVICLPVYGYKNSFNLSHALAVAATHIHWHQSRVNPPGRLS